MNYQLTTSLGSEISPRVSGTQRRGAASDAARRAEDRLPACQWGIGVLACLRADAKRGGNATRFRLPRFVPIFLLGAKSRIESQALRRASHRCANFSTAAAGMRAVTFSNAEVGRTPVLFNFTDRNVCAPLTTNNHNQQQPYKMTKDQRQMTNGELGFTFRLLMSH